MSLFSQRLRQALQDSVYSASSLARKLGLSRQTLSAYLTGTRTPKAPTLRALAQALRVSEAWLSGQDVPRTRFDPSELSAAPGLQSPPVFLEKPDPAGGHPHAVPVSPACDTAFLCPDDSLKGARVEKGDLVLIRFAKEVPSGTLAAVLVNGQVQLRRWYRTEKSILLESANPDYPPQLFYHDEKNDVQLIGPIVGFISLFSS